MAAWTEAWTATQPFKCRRVRKSNRSNDFPQGITKLFHPKTFREVPPTSRPKCKRTHACHVYGGASANVTGQTNDSGPFYASCRENASLPIPPGPRFIPACTSRAPRRTTPELFKLVARTRAQQSASSYCHQERPSSRERKLSLFFMPLSLSLTRALCAVRRPRCCIPACMRYLFFLV